MFVNAEMAGQVHYPDPVDSPTSRDFPMETTVGCLKKGDGNYDHFAYGEFDELTAWMWALNGSDTQFFLGGHDPNTTCDVETHPLRCETNMEMIMKNMDNVEVDSTEALLNAIHHLKALSEAENDPAVEKLAYQLNEEAEWTERPIRRLSKVMYGSTCADMQVDVMGECLSSIKHVVGARRNRRQIAGEIARHTTQATGRPISRFTVARRLHAGGLFARRPVRCVPLTPAHRRRRSLWCREHRNWRDNERGRVLFTDESRFSLSSDSHRILIWRERGSRNHPSSIIERDRYGGRGVLVWGGIMLGSRTDLHILDAGSVNGTRYCNEILLPCVRLFRGAMGLQFLFMDDNAPCHRTVAAEQLLESRHLAARTLPPVTIRELRLALQDEWATMSQQPIDTLILSMGRRCETCLAVRGDHIPY
ncbi:transposable element Tcb2 transposase [Trichonephila clavipes]|uniref:Transposable element Tcb2 transposase n=1 Tax=Trichonephila clavipes TaxID=2585209 RepID=A0A8X6V0A8_TRICX|nr:transposable element Tcb2 transposase [Trichonephila clavipes]